jgi:hypothetical protein
MMRGGGGSVLLISSPKEFFAIKSIIVDLAGLRDVGVEGGGWQIVKANRENELISQNL